MREMQWRDASFCLGLWQKQTRETSVVFHHKQSCNLHGNQDHTKFRCLFSFVLHEFFRVLFCPPLQIIIRERERVSRGKDVLLSVMSSQKERERGSQVFLSFCCWKSKRGKLLLRTTLFLFLSEGVFMSALLGNFTKGSDPPSCSLVIGGRRRKIRYQKQSDGHYFSCKKGNNKGFLASSNFLSLFLWEKRVHLFWPCKGDSLYDFLLQHKAMQGHQMWMIQEAFLSRSCGIWTFWGCVHPVNDLRNKCLLDDYPFKVVTSRPSLSRTCCHLFLQRKTARLVNTVTPLSLSLYLKTCNSVIIFLPLKLLLFHASLKGW